MCEGEPQGFVNTYEDIARLMAQNEPSCKGNNGEVPGARAEAALIVAGTIFSLRQEQARKRDLPQGAPSSK